MWLTKRRSRVACLTLAVLCSTASAQRTWIVDEANGPGTDFVDIPPAVAAAADGDIIRVRFGSTYTGFTISGKGLRILAQSLMRAQLIQIQGTQVGQDVFISGLSVGAVQIQDTLGRVTLADMDIGQSGGFRPSELQAHRCAQLHLHAVNLLSPVPSPNRSVVDLEDCYGEMENTSIASSVRAWVGSPDGVTGIKLNRSHLLIANCRIRGGQGRDMNGNGGPAIVARGASRVVALRNQSSSSVIQGGDAGNWPSTTADGGPGIVLQSGSTALFEGLEPEGGPGVNFGPPAIVDVTSTLTTEVNARPMTVFSNGGQQRGGNSAFIYASPLHSVTFLVVGTSQAFIPIDSIGVGALTVDAAGSVLLDQNQFAPLHAPRSTRILWFPHDPHIPRDTLFPLQFFAITANKVYASNSSVFFIES